MKRFVLPNGVTVYESGAARGCSPFPEDPTYDGGTASAPATPLPPSDASQEEPNKQPVSGDAGKEKSTHE